MDLSPKSFPKSEIEDNKEFVKLGMEIVFYGEGFAEYYTVVDYDQNGFTLEDFEGDEHSYEYSSLQVGWEFHNIKEFKVVIPDVYKENADLWETQYGKWCKRW